MCASECDRWGEGGVIRGLIRGVLGERAAFVVD